MFDVRRSIGVVKLSNHRDVCHKGKPKRWQGVTPPPFRFSVYGADFRKTGSAIFNDGCIRAQHNLHCIGLCRCERASGAACDVLDD